MLKTFCVCDCCGAVAAPITVGGVEFFPAGWTEGKPNGLDLCPECVRKALCPVNRLYEAVGYTASGTRHACTARSLRAAVQRLTETGRLYHFKHVMIKRLPISELRQGREGRWTP